MKQNQVIIETLKPGNSRLNYKLESAEQLTVVLMIHGDGIYAVDVSVHLTVPHSSTTVIGIVQGEGSGEVSFHTMQYHEAPNTTSDLLVKSVLSDRCKMSYEGGIYVDPVAQRTNAYQRNENLLLGEFARAYSMPSLEILANDVRCTHGATIGTINKEELWYLATRGIGKAQASDMIAKGFLQSAFMRVSDTMVRDYIEKKVTV